MSVPYTSSSSKGPPPMFASSSSQSQQYNNYSSGQGYSSSSLPYSYQTMPSYQSTPAWAPPSFSTPSSSSTYSQMGSAPSQAFPSFTSSPPQTLPYHYQAPTPPYSSYPQPQASSYSYSQPQHMPQTSSYGPSQSYAPPASVYPSPPAAAFPQASAQPQWMPPTMNIAQGNPHLGPAEAPGFFPAPSYPQASYPQASNALQPLAEPPPTPLPLMAGGGGSAFKPMPTKPINPPKYEEPQAFIPLPHLSSKTTPKAEPTGPVFVPPSHPAPKPSGPRKQKPAKAPKQRPQVPHPIPNPIPQPAPQQSPKKQRRPKKTPPAPAPAPLPLAEAEVKPAKGGNVHVPEEGTVSTEGYPVHKILVFPSQASRAKFLKFNVLQKDIGTKKVLCTRDSTNMRLHIYAVLEKEAEELYRKLDNRIQGFLHQTFLLSADATALRELCPETFAQVLSACSVKALENDSYSASLRNIDRFNKEISIQVGKKLHKRQAPITTSPDLAAYYKGELYLGFENESFVLYATDPANLLAALHLQ